MRVAFSGSHRVGKTTLIGALAERLPAYAVVEEPYWLLEEEGYELSDPPSSEDYERQLRRSIEAIADAPRDALVDRCPLDFLAYLQAIDDELDVDDWVDDVRDSIALLDLVVVIPIEIPDRIAVAAHEDRRLRRRVDERLRTLALDDPFGFDVETLEVGGDLDARVRQVVRAIRA
jgi:hypothetical protein